MNRSVAVLVAVLVLSVPNAVFSGVNQPIDPISGTGVDCETCCTACLNQMNGACETCSILACVGFGGWCELVANDTMVDCYAGCIVQASGDDYCPTPQWIDCPGCMGGGGGGGGGVGGGGGAPS